MKKQALKLVENATEDALAGYEPLLLSTVEMLDAYWPQTAVVLQRCIDDAMDGEMTVDDLYEGIKSGRMYAIVIKNDVGELPDVALAFVMETVVYPQKSVLNIVALGGREFNVFKSRFWKTVCNWAFINGVRTLQASASPAMARILSKFGFEQVYVTMRMDLTEM